VPTVLYLALHRRQELETMSKPSTNQTSAAFKSLCYGARFQYVGSDRTWVKVGPDLIAEWDASKISDSWIGQALCSFSDDGDVTTVVNLVPELPVLPLAPSRLTREQQIVAMADSLRTCRWFKTPDGIPEDKHMVWATNIGRPPILRRATCQRSGPWTGPRAARR
jgi:hypothetical protein